MSRSKHTRPRAIRAADRLRDPLGARGADDPSRSRRVLARLKEQGIVPRPSGVEVPPDWPLPRFVVRRPRPGHFHPAGRSAIAATLRRLGETCVYGLRAIELRQGAGGCAGLQLGRLMVPGRILLYDQLPSPWRLAGLSESDARLLRRAGAEVEELAAGGALVSWPGETLEEFMLFDVLMHEVGHHLLQHHKGKRTVRVARTRDHEAWAEAFAAECRAACGHAR